MTPWQVFPDEAAPGAAAVLAIDEALHGPLLHGGLYRALTLRCPCRRCCDRRGEYGDARVGNAQFMHKQHQR